MHIDSKKCLRKRDVAKKKEIKQEKCTEKRKHEDKICLTSKGKKFNLGQNCKSSQSQTSLDKSAYDSTQINSNKCLHKRDITRRKKIKKTRKGVLKRKNKHLSESMTKKLHLYSMFKKQNLTNTLKRYAMRNL